MKSPPSFKTRVALTCLLGGLLFYTCRPRLQEFTADWKPAPAVAFFASEAELRAWMGVDGSIAQRSRVNIGPNVDLVEVRRQLVIDGFGLHPYSDLSLFQRVGTEFRLIANLPFSWLKRETFFRTGYWIVYEVDWKIRGSKRIAEVRLDRTEPLIVSATE